MTVDLRELRINRGLSVTDAAREIGISRRTLGEVERGPRRPHASTAFKIANFYGYKVTEIWPLEPQAEAV